MTPQLNPADFAAWLAAQSAALPLGSSAALPVVLDVREPWELQTAGVTPAGFTLLAMPMREVPARLPELTALGLDHPLACLCHHGMRSQQVADYLAHNGFTEVVNVQGGIDAWAQQLDTRVPRY